MQRFVYFSVIIEYNNCLVDINRVFLHQLLALFITDAYSLVVLSQTQGNVSFNTPNHFYTNDFLVQAPIKLIKPTADCNLSDFEPLNGYIIVNTEFSYRLCNLGAWRDRGVLVSNQIQIKLQ